MSKLKRLIKDSIKSRTLTYNAFSILISKLGYGDINLAGQNARYKSFNKLKREYSKYLGKNDYPHYDNDENEKVWVCWLQGIENAPILVKKCYESIQKNITDKDIVLITAENVFDYITLPDYIVKKWKSGIITNTHFSDIVRLELLIEHGGLWIDLTAYLTDKLPSYITDSDFFVYHDGFFECEVINMGSWLMYSKTNNIIIQETQMLLFEYWKTHNYLHQYFLMHLFFRMSTDYHKQEWSRVAYFNQMDQHILSKEIEKPFDQKRFDDLNKLTPIHKLSNKVDYSSIDDNSFYAYICK